MVGAERTAAPIYSHRGNPGVRNPKFPTPIAIRDCGSIGECEGEPRRLTILVGAMSQTRATFSVRFAR